MILFTKKIKKIDKIGRPKKVTSREDRIIINLININNKKSFAEISHILKKNYRINIDAQLTIGKDFEKNFYVKKRVQDKFLNFW